MLSQSSPSSSSFPSVDPYSDELPPIDVQPQLARQSPFYHFDTSPQVPSYSRLPSLPSMSCAASFRSSSSSSSLFAANHPLLQQSSTAVLTSPALRSSQSVDALQMTCKLHAASATTASFPHSLHHEWQEERKEAPLECDHEHKEQQQQQQQQLQTRQPRQQRIRDVSRTRHQSHRQSRERSSD